MRVIVSGFFEQPFWARMINTASNLDFYVVFSPLPVLSILSLLLHWGLLPSEPFKG